MKTLKLFAVLILMGCSIQVPAQNSLKNYLISSSTNKATTNNDALDNFKSGQYESAYEKLSKMNTSELFNYEEFLQNALIYQRDSLKLRQALRNIDINLSEFQAFFAMQNQMRIELKGRTTVKLDKNLLKGVISKDTITILFDTGGAGISINPELVEKYNMIRDTTISVHGYAPAYNYRSISHPTIIPSITIGNMTLKNVPAKYNPNKKTGERKTIDGPKFDIIMGMDLFVGLLKHIAFDWDAKELTFSNIETELVDANDFIMFDAKPIALFSFKNEYYTTLLDTGSAVDLINKEIYLNHYSKKEQKSYGDFIYNVYTLEVNAGANNLSLAAADYKPDFNLKLNDENIDFIIGNNRHYLELDLVNNQFIIK